MGICLPSTLKIPHTYIWYNPVDYINSGHTPSSPNLPTGATKLVNLTCTCSKADISGFFFYSQPSYQPPTDLTDFLKAGPPPIYIGFGSIVIDDPTNLTQILLQVISTLNIRALISKGWGELSSQSTPDNVFFLDNVPHDWLFPRVQVVVHHGGAGTTAMGLKCGKPTVVVSFFGDQKFWGEMCARAGAGPNPIPFKELTVDNLVDGIKFALGDDAKRAAEELSLKISKEDGVRNAVDGFYRLLPLKKMRCCVFPDKVAIWSVPELNLGISSQVAGVLDNERKLDLKKLKLSQHKSYDIEKQQVSTLIIELRLVGSNYRFIIRFNRIWR